VTPSVKNFTSFGLFLALFLFLSCLESPVSDFGIEGFNDGFIEGGIGNGDGDGDASDFQFDLVSVVGGLNFPVAMAFAPDGRLFYNEFTMGRTMILDPTNWAAPPQVFCTFDIGTAGFEQGLLGIALDPNFLANGFVYVYYTANGSLVNRVTRVTDDNGTCINPVDLFSDIPSNGNHNGGILRFGPDGFLYISIGDTENSGSAQDLGELTGKILRVQTDGSPAPGNPFIGVGGAREEIFALGLRNVFGMAFHPNSNDLWVTDNGPNVDDEVNQILSGENYGWPTVTGNAGNPAFEDPLVVFPVPIGITGIYGVASTGAYPSVFHNDLFICDFNNGRVQRIELTGGGFDQLELLETLFNGGQGALISMAQGLDGFLYLSGFSEIFRLEFSSI